MKIITKAVMDMETLEWVFEESYEYAGPVAQCCGPTAEQKQEALQSQQFSQAVQNNYGTLFNEQQQADAGLTSFFNQEINAPQGLGAQGLAAQQTLALDNAGASYRNAAQALNSQQAGRGGDTGLQSGPQQQQQAALASAAAGQTAQSLLGIQQENASIQQQQQQAGSAGLLALSGQYNPTNAANATTNALGAASTEADQIAQASNQEFADIAGTITGVAQAGATAYAGGAAKPPSCWIAAAVYGGWDDPRVHQVRNYIFNDWAKNSIIGAAVASVYTAVGEPVSRVVKRSPILQKVFKSLFDIALRKSS